MELENDLDKGVIPAELKNIFELEGFQLSKNATIRKEKGNGWEILDSEKIFSIKRSGEKLDIYEDAEEKKGFINKIDENIINADACLLITSSGGATGSGSIPFIAKYIKENYSIPVITLVILPFSYESHKMFSNTYSSICEIAKSADVTIVIDNDQFNESKVSIINKKINEIIKDICYPHICPYGKPIDIADFAWLFPESSVLVPSLIQHWTVPFEEKLYLVEVREPTFEENLKKGCISEELNDLSQTEGHSLSENAAIRKEKGWKMIDGNKFHLTDEYKYKLKNYEKQGAEKKFGEWLKNEISKNILVEIEEEEIKGAIIYFYFTKDMIELGLDKDLVYLSKIIKALKPDIPQSHVTINYLSSFERGFRLLIFYSTDANCIRKKYQKILEKDHELSKN